MSGDVRIATLCLHGCGYYKRDDRFSQFGQLDDRFIYLLGQPRKFPRLIYRYSMSFAPSDRWTYNGATVMDAHVETQWGAGLIETIPEKLFMQFLDAVINSNSFTR